MILIHNHYYLKVIVKWPNKVQQLTLKTCCSINYIAVYNISHRDLLLITPDPLPHEF